MTNKVLIGIGFMVLAVGSTQAEEAIPALVKAKMNSYVGEWEFSEEVMESPSSDPVTVAGKWTARWIFDNLIEWRSTFSSEETRFTTVEYEGYDRQNKGHSDWFASNGFRGNMYDGIWDGNTVSFQQIVYAPDGSATRERCKFSYSEDFSKNDYACETLTNGAWWTYRRGSAKK